MGVGFLFSIALMFAFSVLTGRAVGRTIEKAKKHHRHDLSAWSEEQMRIIGGKARCR